MESEAGRNQPIPLEPHYLFGELDRAAGADPALASLSPKANLASIAKRAVLAA